MLVSAILFDAYKMCGVVGDLDAALSTQQAADGLNLFNLMVEAWNAEGLLTPYLQTENFALVAGQQSYTIGSAGNFNTTRPLEIVEAHVRDSGNQDQPIDIVGWEEFQRITAKLVSGPYPDSLTFQKATPLGVIWLWPVPSVVYQLYLTTRKQWSTYAAANDLTPQAGVLKAMRYNLAVEVCAFYGIPLSALTATMAANALTVLRRQNVDRSAAPMNSGILQGRRGGYDITRGY